MPKRLLILLTVSQMLFISAWANAHMSAEPHHAFESVHLHFDAAPLNTEDNHADNRSESDEHESHVHLCFCALDFSYRKPLPAQIHAAPQSIELALISRLQSPPTPPPTA